MLSRLELPQVQLGRATLALAEVGGMVPPVGYLFLIDVDGYYLVDSDGYYLLGAL